MFVLDTCVPVAVPGEYTVEGEIIHQNALTYTKIFVMFLAVEQIAGIVLFIGGLTGKISECYLLMSLFFCVALLFEVLAHQRNGKVFQGRIVKTVVGIPIECFRIPQLWWGILTLTPTYCMVLSTFLVCGQSFEKWDAYPAAQTAFEKNWKHIPILGAIIGKLGTPWMIALFLFVGVALHFSGVLRAYRALKNLDCYEHQSNATMPFLMRMPTVDYTKFELDKFELLKHLQEGADAANLPFLGKCFRQLNADRGPRFREAIRDLQPNTKGDDTYVTKRQMNRMMLFLVVKLPILHFKISYFSCSYKYLDSAEWKTALFAIMTSFLSILQTLPDFLATAWVAAYALYNLNRATGPDGTAGWILSHSSDKWERFQFIPVCIFVAILSLELVHFGGVFVCDSHDFSIFCMQCTKV